MSDVGYGLRDAAPDDSVKGLFFLGLFLMILSVLAHGGGQAFELMTTIVFGAGFFMTICAGHKWSEQNKMYKRWLKMEMIKS
jgi:hypothetical protein